MLCEFAKGFPRHVANFLERDRGLTRNFREESVTDLLMAGLVGLEPFGVKVVFPFEPTTGADMDWVFVAPLEVNGGSYLRLRLQAKRAQHCHSVKSPYWYYHHLDHGKPPGMQAQTLVSSSATSPGGQSTLPLYIFYHPKSALAPKSKTLPAIDGINVVFASAVAKVVKGGCKRKEKKIECWRKHFMPLSDLLCWHFVASAPPPPPSPDMTAFAIGDDRIPIPPLSGTFHPEIVLERLMSRANRQNTAFDHSVNEGIPDDVGRFLAASPSDSDRKTLERPLVLLTTSLTRESPGFPGLLETE
jgi:hypothetical protein